MENKGKLILELTYCFTFIFHRRSLYYMRVSASYFSFQYLLLSLTSIINPSTTSWRKQSHLKIWPIELAFLRTILFSSLLFSRVRSKVSSLITSSPSPFSSSTKFQSSPTNATNKSITLNQFLLSSVFSLIFKRGIYLLNAPLAIIIKYAAY